ARRRTAPRPARTARTETWTGHSRRTAPWAAPASRRAPATPGGGNRAPASIRPILRPGTPTGRFVYGSGLSFLALLAGRRGGPMAGLFGLRLAGALGGLLGFEFLEFIAQQAGLGLEQTQHHHEESGHENDGKRGGCQHAAQHADAYRALAGRAGARGDRQRDHAQDERERGHENGA